MVLVVGRRVPTRICGSSSGRPHGGAERRRPWHGRVASDTASDARV